MAGIARIAAEAGHRVTGSDATLHPPMSTQLEQAGIDCMQGYDPKQLEIAPDCVVVGNVMRRGMPIVEQLLNSSIPYVSGPQWLGENLLRQRHVLAVAGTHGKTTTSAMLAHILSEAGQEPGYLIGGVPAYTQKSAQAGQAPYFVIEADEYDTAFFDKRSKFVHYYPRTLILNNLEYDHADIFDDLAAIQRQFHHLLRMMPGGGHILYRSDDVHLREVLEMGCWTPAETFGFGAECDWRCLWEPSGVWAIEYRGQSQQTTDYHPLGAHNALNATAAVAAAAHVGIPIHTAMQALASFEGVLRRLHPTAVTLGSGQEARKVWLYDDFAHHPSEMRASIEAVREHHPDQTVIAVADVASNSMRMGVHQSAMQAALEAATHRVLYVPEELQWDVEEWAGAHAGTETARDSDELAVQIKQFWQQNSTAGEKEAVILVMSNRPGSALCEQLKVHLQSAD